MAIKVDHKTYTASRHVLLRHNRVMQICSPGRQKRCGDGGRFVPGACYTGKLTDAELELVDNWGEIREFVMSHACVCVCELFNVCVTCHVILCGVTLLFT